MASDRLVLRSQSVPGFSKTLSRGRGAVWFQGVLDGEVLPNICLCRLNITRLMNHRGTMKIDKVHVSAQSYEFG